MARGRERPPDRPRGHEAAGRRDREDSRRRNGQGDGARRVAGSVGRIGEGHRVGVGPGSQRIGRRIDRDRDRGRRADGQGPGRGRQCGPSLGFGGRPVDGHAARVLERVDLARRRERAPDRPRRCEAAGRCDRESTRRGNAQGDRPSRGAGPVGHVGEGDGVIVGPGGQRVGRGIDRDRHRGRRAGRQRPRRGRKRRPGLAVGRAPADSRAARVPERVGLVRRRERSAGEARRGQAAGRCDRENARRRHRQADGAGRVPGPVGRVRDRQRVGVGPGGQRVGRAVDQDVHRDRGAGSERAGNHEERRPGPRLRGRPVDARSPRVLERIRLGRGRERSADRSRGREPGRRRDREDARRRHRQGDGAVVLPDPLVVLVKVTVSA
ncbi:MAG: hypothetical protein MZV63_64600 [Marinilabiliales bacterium]|nr:hypothetical protein [Marinilabiliales bacterium]